MELIERIGGLGRMQLSAEEKVKVNALREIISQNGFKDFLGRDSSRTGEYNSLMEELFPAFPLSYDVLKRKTDRFLDNFSKQMGSCDELVVRSTLSLKGNRHGYNDAQLLLVLPNDPGGNKDYLMTVALHPSYQLDPIDDVAARLGERENPPVSSPQRIKEWGCYHKEIRDSDLSFAEVPSLGVVRSVYERAVSLINECDQRISVSKNDLDTLRTDAASHPNLVVRRGSAGLYADLLKGLTEQ